MTDVDVYFSFRSPYSYLATPGMLAIKKNYNINLNLRPILPVAIRTPETLFSPANAPRARYIQLDWPRRARFLGMSDKWPSPDPIVQDMTTLEVSEDQPYIYRLSYLGVEAQHRGRGPEFAFEVSHLLFGGTRNWHEGDHLEKAVERAGLSLGELEAAIKSGQQIKEIEQNQNFLDEAGHWGVPTFVINGEPFFGQDRIDTLCWHMDGLGLKKGDKREMELKITNDLQASENSELRSRLDEYNEPFVGKRETIDLGYAIRNEEGDLVGGLIGSVVWTMLHINVIWVSDSLRGNDYGSKLLLQAEQEAKKLGAEFVRLHTFSFQARPFYEMYGYVVISETENFPRGHSQYLMVKAL